MDSAERQAEGSVPERSGQSGVEKLVCDDHRDYEAGGLWDCQSNRLAHAVQADIYQS